MRYILLLFLCCTLTANAQTTGPKTVATSKRDTVIKPRSIVLPQGRQLPPSLRAELAQKQTRAARTIVFRDTISASLRQRQHFNDSTFSDSLVFTDSALSLVDSAVSLTHKEWLDSQVVELPEIARFGDKIHFNYPIRIQAEAFRKDVPFDTSVLALMNPVTLENLPFFDESPIPLPLARRRDWDGYFETGAGNLYLPLMRGAISVSLNDRTRIDGFADYRNRGAKDPIRQYWGVGADIALTLGEDPATNPYHSSKLTAKLGTTGNQVHSAIDTVRFATHTLSNTSFATSLEGNAGRDLNYEIHGGLNWFGENLEPALNEPGQQIGGLLRKSWFGSSIQLLADARYERVGSETDFQSTPVFDSITQANWVGGSDHDLSELRILVGGIGTIDWLVGASVHSGAGAIQPQAMFRWTLNPRWELGGSFEPRLQLVGHKHLAEQNPFFTPMAIWSLIRLNDTNRSFYDARRVVRENVNLCGYMNYFLSTYDQVGVGLQLLTRENEPVFFERISLQGTGVYWANAVPTRRLILDAHASILLFAKDIATAKLEYRSATITSTNTAIPFEPTFRATASYTLNSIDRLTPTIEFVQLSRKDRSLSFLNFRAAWTASPKFTILLSGENLLNGPGDYWTGYNETPRSITASVRYTF
jgi:hypothetical protein